MATLKDIADRVGVTITVVSHVLNDRLGKIRVSEVKRQQILKVARELQYVPNRSARTLSTRRNRALGLIANHPRSVEVTTGANGYIFNALIGLHRSCDKIGYRCVYDLADMRSKTAFIPPSFLQERSVDGLVLLGYVSLAIESLLLATGLPTIHLGTNLDPSTQLKSISADLSTGVQAILRRALQRNFEHIHLYLSKGPGAEEIAARFQSYPALRKSRSKASVNFSSGSFSSVQEAWSHGATLGRQAQPPDLIIASIADIPFIAAGLHSEGLHCPDDVELVALCTEGYHEEHLAITRPLSLAQLVLPLIDVANLAGRYLVDRLEDALSPQPLPSTVACRYLPGDSAPSLTPHPQDLNDDSHRDHSRISISVENF